MFGTNHLSMNKGIVPEKNFFYTIYLHIKIISAACLLSNVVLKQNPAKIECEWQRRGIIVMFGYIK
jgi:hypothetical protein